MGSHASLAFFGIGALLAFDLYLARADGSRVPPYLRLEECHQLGTALEGF